MLNAFDVVQAKEISATCEDSSLIVLKAGERLISTTGLSIKLVKWRLCFRSFALTSYEGFHLALGIDFPVNAEIHGSATGFVRESVC